MKINIYIYIYREREIIFTTQNKLYFHRNQRWFVTYNIYSMLSMKKDKETILIRNNYKAPLFSVPMTNFIKKPTCCGVDEEFKDTNGVIRIRKSKIPTG
jgi:hypothetical protein